MLLPIFQKFSLWFKMLLVELVNNFLSVLFIFVVYLVLWYFPQAIDLLLILNQSDSFFFEVPFYFTLISISAFIIWNTPKYLYYHNYKRISIKNLIGYVPNNHYGEQKKVASYAYLLKCHMRKVIPRILATLLLIITALSIIHAMESSGLVNVYTDVLNPSLIVLVSVIVLLFLTEPRWYHKIRKKMDGIKYTTLFIYGLLVLLFGFIISLGTFNTQTEQDLGTLFLSNSALALSFFIVAFNSKKILNKIPKSWFYGLILTSGLMILGTFVFLNFIPKWTNEINPLSIILMGLLSLFMISFLLLLGGKLIKLPLFTIIFLLMLMSGSFFSTNDTFDHYQLDLLNSSYQRKSIDNYVFDWIEERRKIIEEYPGRFPVFFTSSEGGGSRAGLWSFLVQSYLYNKTDGRYFDYHLLSVTGASGGSVGNSFFFSEAQKYFKKQKKTSFELLSHQNLGFTYKASAIYRENYLSSSLLALLGRDLLKNTTNLFRFKDRGKLLEDQWSDAYARYFDLDINEEGVKKEYLSYYQNTNVNTQDEALFKIPLLFVNTTHTQTGSYNVISPVIFKKNKEFAGLEDFLSNLEKNHTNKSISLSTAARINASFPFVTPVGEVKGKTKEGRLESDQYADSGYYDNIGGVVTQAVEKTFNQVITDSFPELKDKIKIVNLVLANKENRKISKTQTQLSAPLATLANVRYGHTKEIVRKLGDDYLVMLEETPIKLKDPTLKSKIFDKKDSLIKPILPLGRYLSTIAIRSMEARLEEVKPKLDSIFL